MPVPTQVHLFWSSVVVDLVVVGDAVAVAVVSVVVLATADLFLDRRALFVSVVPLKL